MAHLIQGFFYQKHSWLDIAHRSEVEGGAGVVIKGGLCRFMYSGVIFPNPEEPDKLIGEMSDHFGESELLGVKITEEEVSFTKKYLQRPDYIKYTFRKEGELWVGEYTGSAVGRGDSKCVVIVAPDDLFLLPE